MGARRRVADESGFTILESVIALSLIFSVLVVLLGGLTTGVRGVVIGRQRGVALALANEILEDARARAYGAVGHDLDSDPTLATDPLITGTSPNLVYTGVTPPEPLAGSSVDAGAAGGTNTNPLFPFSPHTYTQQRDGSRYTTSVYVTTITPASGDPFKRISVTVSWRPGLSSAARTLSLSTFLYNVVPPPDPRLIGQGEADSGTFTLCPVSTDPCVLTGLSLSQSRLSLPYVSGAVDSGFIRTARGTANSGSASIDLLAGLPTGCQVLGLTGTCSGAKADASADNDTGTAPPDTDQEGSSGPVSATGGAVAGPLVLSASLGSGTAQAQATGRSCWACQAAGTPKVGDDDLLPYFYGNATGPASLSAGFAFAPGVLGLIGALNGTFLSVGTACSVSCANVTIDRDTNAGNGTITSTAGISYPSMKLMNFTTGLLPGSFSGMVSIGTGTATATAAAGPGTAAPTVTGTSFSVKLYSSATSNYHTYTVTPGGAMIDASTGLAVGADPTSHLVFSPLLGVSVTMDATVHASQKVVSTNGPVNGYTENSAALNNWLDAKVTTTITVAGVTLASFTVDLDYGRVAASASYETAP